MKSMRGVGGRSSIEAQPQQQKALLLDRLSALKANTVLLYGATTVLTALTTYKGGLGGDYGTDEQGDALRKLQEKADPLAQASAAARLAPLEYSEEDAEELRALAVRAHIPAALTAVVKQAVSNDAAAAPALAAAVAAAESAPAGSVPKPEKQSLPVMIAGTSSVSLYLSLSLSFLSVCTLLN